MGTAYIEVTIEPEVGGIFLFCAEAVAEVEYTVEDGDLIDWNIRDFRFDKYQSVWNDMDREWSRKKVAEHWCPDVLRPALIAYVDKDKLEEALCEHLHAEGELAYFNEGLRADYRAAVL